MKSVHILIFCFLFIQNNYSQTNIATYELTAIEKESYDEYLAMAQEDAYSNYFYLIFDKNNSLFTSTNLINGRIGMSGGLSRTTSEIIFDNKEKIYYYKRFLTDQQKQFCVKRKETVKWEITDEKKIINDIECYYAVGTFKSGKSNIRIDAWFAPSIPFSYGPSFFNGLPGLVVMAVEGDEYFLSLSDISFNVEVDNENTPITEKICDNNLVTYEEYLEILSTSDNE